MSIEGLVIVAVAFLAYALVSGRLRGTVLTAPMLFVTFGFIIGEGLTGMIAIESRHGLVHTIAELTLVLVLFTDATRIKLSRLRRFHNLPMRTLVVGLPLVMAFGTLVALAVFPNLELWEAALLAAVLAPTDAALGQAVVSNPVVPVRIRQSLNVESGLNDGIALPAVLLFASLASMSAGSDDKNWITFIVLQITLGPLVGGLIGWCGARLLDSGIEKGWIAEASQGIGILSVAILAFALAEWSGGNGFIAAFIGGLAFGASVRHECHFLYDFMETEGELLMLATFLMFGAAMLPGVLTGIDARVVIYALLSLTVIRMLPVTLSLLGTGVRPATHLFLGWFGPRGLASILFALLIVEKMQVPAVDTVLTVTVVTVTLSVLLHGITAAPAARRYGNYARRMGECEELQDVPEMPLRSGMVDMASDDATDTR